MVTLNIITLLVNLSQETMTVNNCIIFVMFQTDPIRAVWNSTFTIVALHYT